MKTSIFWNITPLKVNRRFGGIYRFHVQGRSVSQIRNRHETARLAICFILVGLIFGPEVESDMFLRNVG
jgi:hypothetical protein